MSKIDNPILYEKVKKSADVVWKSSRGIYRSSWIVSQYKKLGGTYSGIKNKDAGLLRWYREKWINLNKPLEDGYEKCGRPSQGNKNYPLCRPTFRITKETPKTYSELSKSAITKAKKRKEIVKGKKNIKFKEIHA
jgi:Family of unknown function (DUF5872)